MKHVIALPAAVLIGLAFGTPVGRSDQAKEGAAWPSFRMQEIETKLGVGYAVLLVDVNGDGKPDIVVVDQTRVVWYENPTWKRRAIIEGMTRPDNVCIAAHDIDGDGKIDFALGADWKPFNTRQGGTLQWLKRGKTLDAPWTMFPIAHEPTIHRIRFADIYGDGKPRLIVGPLMGQNSTKENNWMDGRPVRLLAYKIPRDPTRDAWEADVLDDKHLHVVHNFWPIPADRARQMDILTASYEGVGLISRGQGKQQGSGWKYERIGAGNQDNPKSNRGASEIKRGRLKSGRKFIATIEPWHGHQVVVYTEPTAPRQLWDRHVVDNKLLWGHAVWCADLDGDGNDELIIGVRDNLSDKPEERRGVRIYKALDGKGASWSRKIIEDGGVAVEDLAAADLNADGKIDIVAVGRQTHNIRIYWNLGPK
jgi:hypothetical protein